MNMRDDGFPFMDDQEVGMYREAVGLSEEERTEEHNKAIQQKHNEADLLTLHELMEKLRDGVPVSERLNRKLEALYRVSDEEGLTA